MDADRNPKAGPSNSVKSMLEQATAFKLEGNTLFKDKQYKKAAGKYHRGLLFLKGIESKQNQLPFPIPSKPLHISNEDLEEIRNVKVAIYNNLSACLLNLDPPKYEKVCQYCEQVLQEEPHNHKAMYRHAVALYHLKNVDPALVLLQKLHVAEPNDSKVKKYLQLCEKESARQDENLKKTYKGMFDSK